MKALILIFVLLSMNLSAQHHHEGDGASLPVVKNIEPQPLLAQALRVGEALMRIGRPLTTPKTWSCHQCQEPTASGFSIFVPGSVSSTIWCCQGS